MTDRELIEGALARWGMLVERDESISGAEVVDWLVDFVHRARESLAATTPPIRVTVSGGVVQDISGVPRGVEVEVRDYDCDERADETLVDDNGDRYLAWTQTADGIKDGEA